MSAAYYVCTTKVDFPATEAPGVPGVLHVCTTKSRLSSHGSSGVPGVLYVCATKVDFTATEAERVRGVLRLHYKKSTFQPRKLRVSAAYCVYYTSRQKKRKNTTVFAPRARENPQRGYVCMSRNAKTRRFWHRANAETRRGVTFVCHKTQKHDGFGTAPTPKPAEGCLRPRKKVPKTTVLAPRPGDYPQRVVRGPKET